MRKVKVIQLAIGVDLIGSKMSMAATKNVDLTELPHGVEMHSKGSNRTIVIPWSNIKGYEIFPDAAAADPKPAKTPKDKI